MSNQLYKDVSDSNFLLLWERNHWKLFFWLEIFFQVCLGREANPWSSNFYFISLKQFFLNHFLNVHLLSFSIDGAAMIFPTSYAATGNQTHISSVEPLWGTLKQDVFPAVLPWPRPFLNSCRCKLLWFQFFFRMCWLQANFTIKNIF